MAVTIPAEGTYSDIERDMIDNEPPGLFPDGQDSLWGQFRKVLADWMQANGLDLFNKWFNNIDPRTVDIDDVPEWEYMLSLPGGSSSLSLATRRLHIAQRLYRGAFTRTQRAKIVESFIIATFGASTVIDGSGIPMSPSGVPLFSGTFSLTGTYNIVENVSAFTYDVRVLNTLSIDVAGLTRELTRFTPAGITFTVTQTATP